MPQRGARTFSNFFFETLNARSWQMGSVVAIARLEKRLFFVRVLFSFIQFLS
jgi:hypothetical protein